MIVKLSSGYYVNVDLISVMDQMRDEWYLLVSGYKNSLPITDKDKELLADVFERLYSGKGWHGTGPTAIHHADGALECTHVSVSCHAPWPPREEASTDWSYVTCRACLATINQKDDELAELKEELNAERAELEGIKVQQFIRDVQDAQDYHNRNETIS